MSREVYPESHYHNGRHSTGFRVLLLSGSMILSACAHGGSNTDTEHHTPAVSTTTSEPTYTDNDATRCQPFTVYAQNRWQPFGAAVRNAPNIQAPKIGGFAANEAVTVDGYIDTHKPVYATNPKPFNSGKWLHVANFVQDSEQQKGAWVTYAGLRKVPTVPDPSGGFSDDGGQPVDIASGCNVVNRSDGIPADWLKYE